ncbi:hypothetical protein ACH5RR_002734 [Cinchona calisaya]|uniref:Uncharacterized protein n=1 Tax=Cinchona calisaya TaxID=153742 RepID=A0ABD3AT52_9GENT
MKSTIPGTKTHVNCQIDYDKNVTICHKIRDCPEVKAERVKLEKPMDVKPRVNARVHAMIEYEAEGLDDVVTGGQTQANDANVQTKVKIQFQAGKVVLERRKPPKTNVARKKSNSARRRSSNPLTNTEGHAEFNKTILNHNEASQTSRSVTLNTGATVDNQSFSSCFSIF